MKNSPQPRRGEPPKPGERIYLHATLEQLEDDGRSATVMIDALNSFRLRIPLEACVRRPQPKPKLEPVEDDGLPAPQNECERVLGAKRRDVAALGRLARDLLGCVGRQDVRLSSNWPTPPESKLTLDGADVRPTMRRLEDLGLVELVDDDPVEDPHGVKRTASRWRLTDPLGRCAAEFVGELTFPNLSSIAI